MRKVGKKRKGKIGKEICPGRQAASQGRGMKTFEESPSRIGKPTFSNIDHFIDEKA